MFNIIQWNARSLYANGLEFKKEIKELNPEIICVQETFLNEKYKFNIKGYKSLRRDRKETPSRGGVAIFIKNEVPYYENKIYKDNEAITITIKIEGTNYNITNIYNPKGIPENIQEIDEIFKLNKSIICGDFNAHNKLWGSNKTDAWGEIIENKIEENNLVILNDGSGTRHNPINQELTGHLDLTIMSPEIAGKSNWEVLQQNCGSDHQLVVTKIGASIYKQELFTPRWNFNKADWSTFQIISEQTLKGINNNKDIEENNKEIIKAIIEAAEKTIPKTKNNKKSPVPFWNNKCQEAVDNKKRAKRKLYRTKNPKDLIEYKRYTAIARKTIKQEKRQYWENYCAKLSYTTNVNKVWKTVRNINRAENSQESPTIKHKDKIIFDYKEKANIFVEQFAHISSNKNYSKKFLKRKEKFEKENKNMFKKQENNDESFNQEFTMDELEQALIKCKNSSPGKDQVCYIMIKNFSYESKKILLEFYNKIWIEGIVPKQWKEAIIIPILKAGKDKSKAISYRPIALTSNLSKLMERMITNRLYWYLESKNLINIDQSGFRKNRRTLDHIIRITDEIQKTLATNQYTVGVFLDIEKAYDMVWKKGILYKLKELGIGGNMFNWINSFLNKRKIQVKIGNEFSEEKEVENGTPQGSAISPILFLIAINDIEIGKEIKKSIFADDTAIWKSGKNLKYLEKKIQKAIKDINRWCNNWGFKISIEKTKVIVFTRKKNKNIKIKLGSEILKNENKIKFLGIILDNKLTWRDHIQQIIDKCKKRINLMRCIAGNSWGASKKTLCYIYKALIRSRIDYGCEVYEAANKSNLKKLEIIQNQCLRICTGAIKSTTTNTLEVDCGVMPLDIRRIKLQIRLMTQYIKTNNDPVKKVLEDSWHKYYSKNKFKSIYEKVKEQTKDKIWNIEENRILPFPPWELRNINVDMSLSEQITKKEPDYIIKIIALEYMTNWTNYLKIYTDGSKDQNKCTAAIHIPEFKISKGYKLDNKSDNYEAELFAILKALIWIEDNEVNPSVIFTDSLSAIQAINSRKSSPNIINEIYYTLYKIQNKGIVTSIVWIPSHVGIKGNEEADKIARKYNGEEILYKKETNKKELYKEIDKMAIEIWQDRWDNAEKGKFYYQINNKVKEKVDFHNQNRKKETTLSRFRYGKNWLNATKFIIGKSTTENCEVCLIKETTEHFLLECPKNIDLTLKLINTMLQENERISIETILDNKKCLEIIWEYVQKMNKI